MEDLIPRLFVGDDNDYKRLEGHSGWSFLRCCKDGPGGHRQTLSYDTMGAPQGPDYLSIRKGNLLALNLIDVDDPAFIPDACIDAGLDFIKSRLAAGDKVLVACNAGHSRSATIALMYLRASGEMPDSFKSSERRFHRLYKKYEPGMGMREHAKRRWAELPNFFSKKG